MEEVKNGNTWGLNCGPRLPKEFIREAKLKIKEADFNNEIKGGL